MNHLGNAYAAWEVLGCKRCKALHTKVFMDFETSDFLLFLVPVSNGAAGAASGRSWFCSNYWALYRFIKRMPTKNMDPGPPCSLCVCRSAKGRWNNACPDWRNEYILIVTLNNNYQIVTFLCFKTTVIATSEAVKPKAV